MISDVLTRVRVGDYLENLEEFARHRGREEWADARAALGSAIQQCPLAALEAVLLLAKDFEDDLLKRESEWRKALRLVGFARGPARVGR